MSNNTSKISSVRIILKSGNEFTVKCEKFSVTQNGFGDMTGYKISGIKENRPLYINISEIVAIVQVPSDEVAEETNEATTAE